VRKRVLISAFALSPNRGSEAGVGWNICSRMGKHHDVVVLYGSHFYRFELGSDIADHEAEHGAVPGVRFCAVPAPWFSKLCLFLHDHDLWAFYYLGYRSWQKAAYRKALELHREQPFDVVHQLNMIGYREPGFLWKLGVPFVWGPVGGAENVPLRFAPVLGARGFVFNLMRTPLNLLQLRCSLRVRSAVAKSNRLISATSGMRAALLKVFGRDSVVIPETGADAPQAPLATRSSDSGAPLRIVWSGLHIARKALPLLLRALARSPIKFQWHLDVLGVGPLTRSWKDLAERLGVASRITWYGWIDHRAALQIMERNDLFVLTSLQEANTTVVMEALSKGLPIVCLDHCGMADTVTPECGIKIPVTSPDQVIGELGEAIAHLALERDVLRRLSAGALRRVLDFSWDAKVDAIGRIYEEVS
jgi:glycosyltransferase involved in cell wall biosynthesis